MTVKVFVYKRQNTIGKKLTVTQSRKGNFSQPEVKILRYLSFTSVIEKVQERLEKNMGKI